MRNGAERCFTLDRTADGKIRVFKPDGEISMTILSTKRDRIVTPKSNLGVPERVRQVDAELAVRLAVEDRLLGQVAAACLRAAIGCRTPETRPIV